jgi:hypothetical protein
MTFSVTIGSTAYHEDYLELLKLDGMEDKEIKLMITTTHEQEDEDGAQYKVTEGQAVTVNYYELIRAIEAVAILPSK